MHYNVVANCPTCGSPEARLHPSTQVEGEVTDICRDSFHNTAGKDARDRIVNSIADIPFKQLSRPVLNEGMDRIFERFNEVVDDLWLKAYPDLKSDSYKKVFRAAMLIHFQSRFVKELES
jgi:hypothetical protein